MLECESDAFPGDVVDAHVDDQDVGAVRLGEGQNPFGHDELARFDLQGE